MQGFRPDYSRGRQREEEGKASAEYEADSGTLVLLVLNEDESSRRGRDREIGKKAQESRRNGTRKGRLNQIAEKENFMVHLKRQPDRVEGKKRESERERDEWTTEVG